MMYEVKIAEAIKKAFDDLEEGDLKVLDTVGDGNHYLVKIRSRHFNGLSSLERHRLVYKALDQWISTGELHALQIEASEKKDVKGYINQLIDSNPVILFMKGTKEMPMCGFSGQVVSILNQLGVDFATFNILEDNEVRETIKILHNWPTFPQLYVRRKLVGGCDIVREMHQREELKPFLLEHSIILTV